MTPTAAPPAAPWANRIVGSGEEAPDQLLANPANWRVHPKAQQAALEGVLGQVGWVQQVLVNRRTGHVVDGHLRVALAIRQAAPTVPVLYVDLSPEEEALVLASLDPLAAMAGTDDEKLRALLADVSVDSDALAAMLAELAPREPRSGLTDPDEIPEPPDAATTQPGDLWVLGDHRLLCGDAGRVTDLDRLLDGATVDLLLTDPPYNVRVEPRSNNAIAAGLSSFPASGNGIKALDAQGLHHSGFDVARGKSGIRHHQQLDVTRHPEKAQATHRKLRAKDRPLVNDFIPDAEFAQRLAAWFGNAARVLRPGGSFYVWGGYANLANYPAPLAAAGLYFSQAIIWDKEHPVLTRKDFMGAHEWAFYGWREGAAHRFFGPPNVPDLWHVKRLDLPPRHAAVGHLRGAGLVGVLGAADSRTRTPYPGRRRAVEGRAGGMSRRCTRTDPHSCTLGRHLEPDRRPLSERDFQRQVLDLARILGWTAYHPMLSKWSERGWPDLAMVRPPRLVFAELKSETGRATSHQERWLGLLGLCPGVETYLWRPADLDAIATVLR